MLRRPKASKSRRNSARHHRSHNRKLNVKKKVILANKKNEQKDINVLNEIESKEEKEKENETEIDNVAMYGNEGKVDANYNGNVDLAQIEGNTLSYVYNDVDDDVNQASDYNVKSNNLTLMGFNNEMINDQDNVNHGIDVGITLMGSCINEDDDDDDHDNSNNDLIGSKSKVITLMGFAKK